MGRRPCELEGGSKAAAGGGTGYCKRRVLVCALRVALLLLAGTPPVATRGAAVRPHTPRRSPVEPACSQLRRWARRTARRSVRR